MHNTAKGQFAVQHLSSSYQVNVCISWRPSWPNQIFHHLSLFFLVKFIHFDLYNVWYLFFQIYKFNVPALYTQLNAGFAITGPLCLYLYGSLWLTSVVSLCLVPRSLCAIITTISACNVTWFTTFPIISNSDMTVCVFAYLEWFCLPKWDFYSWHHELLLALIERTLM